jgi:hypothetical protein
VVDANATNGAYIDVTTANNGAATGDDLIMGAPYSASPYTAANLSAAATATSGNINFTFSHKKPEVDVILTTTTGTDKVVLDGATVSIKNSVTSGTFYLKDLSCVLSSTRTASYTVPSTNATTHTYSCFVLPQSLDGVSMSVTTKDGNTYPVIIYSATNTNGTSNWVEGKKYTYTLLLKKTGILTTASLTDWDNVSVTPPDVHL